MTTITRNGVSLDLPDDWELWNQNRWAGTDTMVAAKIWDGTWPNMEVSNLGEEPNSDVEYTRAFAQRWVKRQRVTMLNERFIQVNGFDAYEFCYSRKPLFRKTFYFCKVSVVIEGIEYMIQLASRDMNKDKDIFDQIVDSIQFEFIQRG